MVKISTYLLILASGFTLVQASYDEALEFNNPLVGCMTALFRCCERNEPRDTSSDYVLIPASPTTSSTLSDLAEQEAAEQSRWTCLSNWLSCAGRRVKAKVSPRLSQVPYNFSSSSLEPLIKP